MAIALVQKKIQSTGGTTVSFTSAPTVGNTVVVAFGKAISAQPANPTDNKGNTYTPQAVVKETLDSGWSMLFTCPVVTSGGTFTITVPTGGTVWIAEYSGVNLATVDHNTNFNTTTLPTALNLSVTAANSLVIATGYDEGSSAQTAGAGFVMQDNEPDNLTHERMMVEAGPFNVGTAAITWGNAVAPWSLAAIALQPTIAATDVSFIKSPTMMVIR